MPMPSLCEQAPAQLVRALRAWFDSPAGRRLLEEEGRLIAEMSSSGVFGYHLVQLQDLGHGAEVYRDCLVSHRTVLDQDPSSGAPVSGISCHEHLPLQSDSVDVFVLPHTLDFSVDPHQVLREVDRVLIPEGRVLIVGFNPLSLWGLWRLMLRWRGDVPWCGHFLSYRRVCDWLGLLGMDVERTDVCAFSPPVKRDSWHQRLNILERLGRKVWPMLAGVYVVRAVKRVSTVRPIRRRWRNLRVFGNVPEPASVKPTNMRYQKSAEK